MTNPKDTAFPLVENNDSTGPIINIWHLGLTKREYFAGLAMQGLITTSPNLPKELAQRATVLFAAGAVEMADALIAELNK